MRKPSAFACFLGTLLGCAASCAQVTEIRAGSAVRPDTATAQAARDVKDVVYATVDGKTLGLDLYLPAGVRNPALLVWVHGGDAFFAGELLERSVKFLRRTLGQ